MKYLLPVIALLLHFRVAWAQTTGDDVLLTAKSKGNLHYVQLNDRSTNVFEMYPYFDKGFSGYLIKSSDSLSARAAGNTLAYEGERSKIVREKNSLFLIVGDEQSKKYKLSNSVSAQKINTHLNNRYFFERFALMLNEGSNADGILVNYRRAAFYWHRLSNQQINHRDFKVLRIAG